MNLIPWFDQRDFTPQAQPVGVRFAVTRHKWTAVGGPDEAVILAFASEPALWPLVDLLRCPVKINRPMGEPVWWGFVERVEIICGELAFVIDLAEMTNRIRVWYRPGLPNSDYALPRVATAWADAGDSQAVYGVKEGQEILPEFSAAGAAALRDLRLTLNKYPVRSLDTEPAGPGEKPVTSWGTQPPAAAAPFTTFARITCKGWWHTTGWRSWEQPAGLAQLANPGGTSLAALGNTAQQQIRGTFTTPAVGISWPAVKVSLRLSKYGAPADALNLSLLSAADAVLATASLPASSLVKAGWYELALSPAVLLSPSTLYKLVLSRSGGQDAANYYRVELDTTQGGDPASFWNGAWQPFNPPASLIFKVAGEEDTISQVACMLAAGSGGQFLSAQDMPAPSGTLVPMWREGQLTAREEIEALLQLGTGNTRYLAAVDINRRLSISPQPAAGAGDYGLLKSGGLLDPYGSPLPPGACAAGVWARAADAGQALLVGPQMADPARIFIEAMEWDNLRERWRITRG